MSMNVSGAAPPSISGRSPGGQGDTAAQVKSLEQQLRSLKDQLNQLKNGGTDGEAREKAERIKKQIAEIEKRIQELKTSSGKGAATSGSAEEAAKSGRYDTVELSSAPE